MELFPNRPYIFVGSEKEIDARIKKHIFFLYPDNTIENLQQQGSVVICSPSGNHGYKKIDLDMALSVLDIKRDNHLFIVIKNAHLLSEAISNSLLKTIEEMPDKTYIFFTTPSESLLLETIQSRSITIHTTSKKIQNNFIDIVISKNTTPLSFHEFLIHNGFNEHDSTKNIIDLMLFLEKNNYNQAIIEQLSWYAKNNSSAVNQTLLWKSIYCLVRS